MGNTDTICAIATARGPGAIGIIRLSGPKAITYLKHLSSRSRFRHRYLYRNVLRHPQHGAYLDDAMLCAMHGPRSYTGEDMGEIFAHGGIHNLERLKQSLLELGARLAEPGEFTRRAVINGKLDLTQAESVADIIAARSDRALANAQAMLRGALGRKLTALREGATELAADLEARIDFADDMDAEDALCSLSARFDRLLGSLQKLVASYDYGKRLNGAVVGLSGRVNAGKSSLFNALLGFRRALVSGEQGTTRDFIEADVHWDGLAVTLIDTAGDRMQTMMSPVESDGHSLGRQRLADADVIVYVIDLTDGGSYAEHLANQQRRGLIVAANHIDRLSAAEQRDRHAVLENFGYPVVLTSAVTGTGIRELKQQIVATIVDGDEPCGDGDESVHITRERHQQALSKASEELRQAQKLLFEGFAADVVVDFVTRAREYLGEIEGGAHCEDVLDAVFSRFCIGK